MIRSLLAFLTIISLGVPAGILLIGWCLVSGDVMPLYRVACRIVLFGFWVAGVRVVVEGLERVPANTACIFMSNHVSNLDPPVLIPIIPGRTSVFLKKSLMKIPVLGYAMHLAKFVPVSRVGSIQGAQESVKAARAVIGQGIHITTFVEGTRSPDGRLLPFKKGPFYLAMEANAPCIPISIWGTETMMRKGSSWIVPGTAHVVFHDPVYPVHHAANHAETHAGSHAGREALMQAVRAAIASGLPEQMR
jgi:1-acyl-sn-glycerol-3-phosphate acyltransferase